jgi:hypothetical protein
MSQNIADMPGIEAALERFDAMVLADGHHANANGSNATSASRIKQFAGSLGIQWNGTKECFVFSGSVMELLSTRTLLPAPRA